MAVLNPFRGLRPEPGMAEKVAALPYDVLNSDEARIAVQNKPWSFLHVEKSEVDLDPNIDHYSPLVYQKAKENLTRMITEGVMIKDEQPYFYLYRQVMKGHVQTGVVGIAAVDDYFSGTIKIHEQTRSDKEIDRIANVDTCNANTGPVFLTYNGNEELTNATNAWTREKKPTYDFVSDDEVRHVLWVVNDDEVIKRIKDLFGNIESLYVADGHHRSAAAAKVGKRRRDSAAHITGRESFNFFLAVAFPAEELQIFDYNRVVKDLNGLNAKSFLDKVEENFTVEESPACCPYRPEHSHEFGLYLDNKWYRMTAKPSVINEMDPVKSLDVYILQHYFLTPILGIGDPKTDKRIDFVGGIRGLNELEKRCGKDGDSAVAIAMYPTNIQDLMRVADANLLMPPKSTWFEPKLRSGLIVHQLDY